MDPRSEKLRVSDEQRELVAREIREHFAAGRLSSIGSSGSWSVASATGAVAAHSPCGHPSSPLLG